MSDENVDAAGTSEDHLVVKLSEDESTNRLLSGIYGAVLENCLENFTILQRILDLTSETEHSEPEDIDTTNSRHSLVYCCTFLKTTLTETVRDLRKNQSYGALVKILQGIDRNRREAEMLLENRRRLEAESVYLNTSCIQDRNDLNEDIQKLTERIGDLKDQINDTVFEQNLKLKLIRQWEQSRIELNTIKCRKKENSLIDKIREKCLNIEQEERIHEETVVFIAEFIKDHQNSIEYWKQEYNSEMKRRQTEIDKMKQKIQKQRDDHQALQLKYDQHKQQIIEYLGHKERLRLEAEELDRKIKKATKIQAWWRGTMYRRGLGPYRKKKAKGKKGSDEKKAKK